MLAYKDNQNPSSLRGVQNSMFIHNKVNIIASYNFMYVQIVLSSYGGLLKRGNKNNFFLRTEFLTFAR